MRFSGEAEAQRSTAACEIMPQLAARASSKGMAACSSSSCTTLRCHVLSNGDGLEVELLPCKGTVAITNQDERGKIVYQETFESSSRIATANIGGEIAEIRVQVVRTEIAMGFGVSKLVSLRYRHFKHCNFHR